MTCHRGAVLFRRSREPRRRIAEIRGGNGIIFRSRGRARGLVSPSRYSEIVSQPRPQAPHLLREPSLAGLLRPRQLARDRDMVLIALVLVELGLALDLIDNEIDDADGGEHGLALGGLHLRKIPGLLRQARLGDGEQRVAMRSVFAVVAELRDAGQMHRLVEPGGNVIARGVPVVGDVGVVAGDDQEEAALAVGERNERVLRGEMELDDDAILAPQDHERHMRSARAALVAGDDHAKAAPSSKFERALLLDAELGSKDMHGAARGGFQDGRSLMRRPRKASRAAYIPYFVAGRSWSYSTRTRMVPCTSRKSASSASPSPPKTSVSSTT